MERDYSKNRRLVLGTIRISAKIKNQLAVENTGIMSMAKPNASAPAVRTEPARR